MGILDRHKQNMSSVEEAGNTNPEILKQAQEEQFQIDPNQQVDFDFNEASKDPQLVENQMNEQLGQETNPDLFKQPEQEVGQFVDSAAIDANMIQQFGTSLKRGTGTVIGGLGDIFQAVPGIVGSAFGNDKWWQENSLSEMFHGFGENIQANNQNFVPDEFKEVKLSTLGSAEGWKYLISNQIAETIPYMIEFIATGYGAGSVAKKGASTLAKKQLSKMSIKDAVKKGAIKGVTGRGVEYGGKGAGNILTRKLLTEKGLSKTGSGLSHAFGAGAANNQLIALSQASESIKEAKMYKDDNGNPLFNDDELAQIAVDTWQTESAYIAADIMSWGFTFGSLSKNMFRGAGIKSASGLTKTTGARISKVLGKMGIEGGEETIQEVFEEWGKKKTIEDARVKKGDLDENDRKVGGFFDFYNNEENEGLKIVAGLMGGLMAGGKASIDLMAEKSNLLRNKEELLKAKFEGKEDNPLKEAQIIEQQKFIADVVQNENHEMLQEAMFEWKNTGAITEDQYQEFVDDTNEYVKVFNKSQNLNVEGVERLYQLLSDNKKDEILLKKATADWKNQIQAIKELELGESTDQVVKAKEVEMKKSLKEQKDLVKKAKDSREKEIANHILGKRFKKSTDSKTGEDIKNEKGEALGRGFSEKDYERFTISGEEEAKQKSSDKKDILDKAEGAINKGVDFAKSFFNRKSKNKSESTEKEETESAEEKVLTPEQEIENEKKFVESLDTDESKFDYLMTQFKKPFSEQTKEEQEAFASDMKSKFQKLFKGEDLVQKQKEMQEHNAKEGSSDRAADNIAKKREDFKTVSNEKSKEAFVGAETSDKVKEDSDVEATSKEDSGDLSDLQKKQSEFESDEKTEPSIHGRFAKQGKSKKEEAFETEANKQGKSVRQYFKTKYDELKVLAKKKKNEKEVQEFLAEIENLEEVQQLKNTKLYKDLVNLKSDEFIKATYNKLKSQLASAKTFVERKNIIKKLRNIENQRSIKKDKLSTERELIKPTKKNIENLYTVEDVHSLNGLSADPRVNSKLSMIKSNLQKNFPGIDLVMVDDLNKVLGVDSMAYIVGSTIFINPESVNKPNVFLHEMSHAYYKLTENQPATKRLVSLLSKDTKSVDKIKRDYWDQISYTMKARNGKTITAMPIEMRFEPKSKSEFISEMVDQGYSDIQESPFSEQEVLKDELFAYNMERKFDKNYDSYFDSKTEAVNRLNFYEKGFWKNVKSKVTLGFTKTTEQDRTLEYLRDFDVDGLPTKKEHLETFITKEFKKGFTGKKLRTAMQGRKRVDNTLNNDVEQSMRNQRNVFDSETSGTEAEFQSQTPSLMDQFFSTFDNDNDTVASLGEEVSTGNLDDKADVYTRSITRTLDYFISSYNKKHYNKKSPLERNKIAFPLRVLAQKHVGNNVDFVKSVLESTDPKIKEFTKWMKIFFKDDYESRLVSMHTVWSTTFVADSFVMQITDNGVEINPGLSTAEQNQSDSVIKGIQQSVDANMKLNKKEALNDSERIMGERYQAFRKVLGKIIDSKPLSNDDYNLVMKSLFDGKGIDLSSLDKEIRLNGKLLPLKTAIDTFMKDKAYRKGNFINFKMFGMRPFINAVISQNRAYSGNMMAQNAEGNNVNMEQKNMFFINENRRISRDVEKMTKEAFNKKYSGNPLASKMFDSKRSLQFMQSLGIKTDNSSSVYKDSKADEVFTNDLLLFLKSGKNSYIQGMPVNGESSRRYYATIPKIILSTLKDGELETIAKKAATISAQSGDVRFKDGNKISGQKLVDLINNETELIIEEFQENPEFITELQSKTDFAILDKNGKITPDGKLIIKSYVTNHTVNQIYLRDLFYTGINEKDLSKRGKSSGAPVTNINSSGSMRMGIINVKDLKIRAGDLTNSGLTDEELNTSDSMNFMLPEDIERIQAIYGSGMVVGKNLKLFSFSKERENKNAMNQSVTIKGLTFPLTDQFVKDNPGYAPLRDALQAQRDYFIENHNEGKELPFNLNNGEKNFIPMAVAASALKTGGIKENSVTMEELKDPKKAIERINGLNEYEGGYGFNGSDIGVQNLMDKPYEKAVMASQLISNLFINAQNLGKLGKVEEMQKIISEISKITLNQEIVKSLPKDANNITAKELSNLKEFIVSSTNPELVDPVTQNILDKYSISLPYIHNKVSEIMKNRIVKSGLRMYTDGTVGLQMADYGMYEKNAETNKYSSTLKSYGVGNNSTSYSDSKGVMQKATTPAEALIPHHFAQKAKTRLRQRFSNPSSAKNKALSIVSKEAISLGLRGDAYTDYVNKHTQLILGSDENGPFVRGEFFIATRIPSHGLQTSLVLEAKGTTGEGMGSAVIVPTELSSIMGSDFDGDALYMNMSNAKKSGEIYDLKQELKTSMIDHLTDSDLQTDLMTSLDMEKLKTDVAAEIEKLTGAKIEFDQKNLESFTYPLSPLGQREAFKDNVETRSLVGISASLHRFMNVLAAYKTKFNLPFSINGVSKTSFEDSGKDNARSYKTALLLNVILDNAKNKIAEKIGITPATATQFILLSGMGYDIPTVSAIMKSDGAKAWIKASNNRNNSFYSEGNKFEVLKNARKLAGVSARAPKNISINTSGLDTADGKNNVIELLNKLDKMQSEAFKVNGVLSTHKKLDANPFTLENQLSEGKKFLKGDGILNYSEEFRKSAFVQKYINGLELALDVNKKTNVAYSATARNLVKSITDTFGREFNPKQFNIIKSKIMKTTLMGPLQENFKFDSKTIINKLYGKGDNIFTRLSREIIKSDIAKSDNSLLSSGFVVKNEKSSQRITLNNNLRNFGNDQVLEKMREEFNNLPQDLKNDLVIYDFIENGLNGTNSIFPIFDDLTIQILGQSFDEALSKNGRSQNMSTLEPKREELYRSLHSLTRTLDYNQETGKMNTIHPNSDLWNAIVDNKPFIRNFIKKGARDSKGKQLKADLKYIVKFRPLTDEQIEEIRTQFGDIKPTKTNRDLQVATQNAMVQKVVFNFVGDYINMNSLGTPSNPLFKDINILNAKVSEPTNTPPPPASKKKANPQGRRRIDSSEGFNTEMTRAEWSTRNDISGLSDASTESYEEYKAQFKSAKKFYDENLQYGEYTVMSDNKLRGILDTFSKYQAEAGSIVTTPISVEVAKREAHKQSKITGVKSGKDLTAIQKWGISSNIPSSLPGLQAIAKKVSERFKKFLRARNEDYEKIDAATKALYKAKFNNSIHRYNPFKNKSHYETLYGNLIVKEVVGDGVNNIRLKPQVQIDSLYESGKLTKEEKDFYDVFTGITKKYEGLLDGKDKRAGYIPHTKQSLLESYASRGILGAFINSQPSDVLLNDVVLRGTDPITGSVISQSFKKFSDAYDIVSQNKDLGNDNKFLAKNLIALKIKANRLQKKGTNEDGSIIKTSSFTIETLANSGSRNRFTKSRSNKATLYPSMDLNKAIMDFTHASSFASQFKDMLPEIQGMINYQKEKGNKNAVELLEVYYRDKILRGQNPTSVLGKTGDKVLKTMNAVTVFSLLGFQSAFVAGNILAGKYHNIKNDKTKKWAIGEKRFWGFDGGESGIKNWYSNFKSSMDFLRKIGFMEQNIYEDINLEKDWNPINKLETLALLPMTLSEKWIQGVQFLGQLSDEEWSNWKENGEMISVESQSKYEDEVKKSQGRGYNYTDQRMVSLYSMGQSLMMFNKFIPTMMNDRFGQEEIDAYGKKHIGSLRQFGDTAKNVISGRMSIKDFNEYRNGLEDHKKLALDKALKGMALVTLAGVVGAAAGGMGDDDTKYLMDGIVMDANYSINIPKLARKANNIPVLGITKDLTN